MKKCFVILMMVCALPLAAQSNDVTVWVSTQMNKGGGRFAADEDVRSKFEDGSGYGVSFSHLFAPRVSGELAVFKTSTPAHIRSASATLADLGDLELTPVTAMVRYHFLPDRMVDVYAGGGVAHVMVDDLDSADLRTLRLAPVSLNDKTTWTLGAGLTFRLSPRFGIGLDARYIPLEVSGHAVNDDTRLSSNLDPLLVSAGLKFRF